MLKSVQVLFDGPGIEAFVVLTLIFLKERALFWALDLWGYIFGVLGLGVGMGPSYGALPSKKGPVLKVSYNGVRTGVCKDSETRAQTRGP